MQTHRTRERRLAVLLGCKAIHTLGGRKSLLGATSASPLGISATSQVFFCSICGISGAGKS